jgi:non-haem Fe2+, alpha-ketoglutarate-dependent halogenase
VVAVPIDETKTVAMELRPGQVSVHNIRLAHASEPNRSGDRRIGISMHYIPTRARQLAAGWDSASLVRGEDRYHHFALAPRPQKDFDADAVRFHERASTAFRDILFKDAEKVRPTL